MAPLPPSHQYDSLIYFSTRIQISIKNRKRFKSRFDYCIVEYKSLVLSGVYLRIQTKKFFDLKRLMLYFAYLIVSLLVCVENIQINILKVYVSEAKRFEQYSQRVC